MGQVIEEMRRIRIFVGVAAVAIVASAIIQTGGYLLAVAQPRIKQTLSDLVPGTPFRQHATARITAGDYRGLISAAKEYQTNNPNDAYGYYYLGIGYQGIGDH